MQPLTWLETVSPCSVIWPAVQDRFRPVQRPPVNRRDLSARWPRAQTGEMFYQKDLAATLRKIAEVEASNAGTGREAALKAARDYIYTGELGHKIAAFNREMGGLLTEEDLGPVSCSGGSACDGKLQGLRRLQYGPWGQGPTFPQALKILEGYDLASMGHNSAEYIHTVSRP